MKETLIDIETYCEADIKKCGLYRYVSDPSFEILLIAWATDEGEGFGETKLADLASGDPFPKELLDDFKDSDVTLIAHNAAFERVSFSRYLQQHYPGRYLKPGTFLSPDNWICTMVMAASLTLPMALKDVGEVLRTTQQKDEEGKRLIKLFSAPCKPTKSNGGRTRNLPHHLPEDWEKFKYYCIQDVNTEVDIYKRLKRFPMPAREWHHYRVNERINDRGVRIDTELVRQAITCDLLLSDAMTTKAYELTGLENPNSVSQLKTWLDERGISMDTLGKKNVTEMIGELDKNGVDAEAMDMLSIRKNGITERVFQSNRWVRVNEYDADGCEAGETYEGRWAECPKPTATDTDEELELSDAQSARNDEIYNAAYEFCKVMAEDDRLEWNMEILGELADLAAELLTRHGSRVRYPAVVTEPDGRQYIEEYHGGIK